MVLIWLIFQHIFWIITDQLLYIEYRQPDKIWEFKRDQNHGSGEGSFHKPQGTHYTAVKTNTIQ